MVLELLIMAAGLFVMGIEAVYVPTDDGGGDYLVRVEPELVRNPTPYTLTSDVPADARNVRRVKIFVADAWPQSVERSLVEAAKRPRVAAVVTGVSRAADLETSQLKPLHPWGLLTGSLITLFLSLGANAYLGMLLASMRARYQRDIQAGIVRV